jgi:hypothetical protein
VIDFQQQPRPKDRKTDIWSVSCRGHCLGQVRWYAQWRRYVYFVTTLHAVLLDPTCLREIADFCETKTQEHKVGDKTR